MIEEANASTGAAIREYIWLDDMPVALVDDTGSSPVINYIHTDQLCTPQKITDGSAALVWDGAFDPFGNPASVTGSVTNPLRFPGQYADGETALNQNWFRDYDPTIGRYLQGDPVGLLAGTNPYNYALGNPARLTDPNGRCPICIAILAGALIGGSLDLGAQLIRNHGNLNCVDWGEVGLSALIGGGVGALGPAAGAIVAGEGTVGIAGEAATSGIGDYLAGSGGRLGGAATRALNNDVATSLEDQGYTVTNGAGRAGEEFIPCRSLRT